MINKMVLFNKLFTYGIQMQSH